MIELIKYFEKASDMRKFMDENEDNVLDYGRKTVSGDIVWYVKYIKRI